MIYLLASVDSLFTFLHQQRNTKLLGCSLPRHGDDDRRVGGRQSPHLAILELGRLGAGGRSRDEPQKCVEWMFSLNATPCQHDMSLDATSRQHNMSLDATSGQRHMTLHNELCNTICLLSLAT